MNTWPFPTFPNPLDKGTRVPKDKGTRVPKDKGTRVPKDKGTRVPKFNPDNYEDAPL